MARFDSLHAWLSWQEGFHPRSIDLGLDRAAQVFAQLNPNGVKPVTLTVAGTNGKGSCIAFLEAIYKAQGYKVGTYTSPHILKYNERIKINGNPVSDALICDAFARIDAVRGDVSLSYFEFGTLAALDIFWQADLDVQLLEVGLGGRLDAVNIIDPDISIISSISIDHVNWLGETREAIAIEKAGIFRTNIPAIVGDCDPPSSLLTVAAEKKTPIETINKDFSYQKNAKDWSWKYNEVQYSHLPHPNLAGEHQFNNAALAIAAITKMQSLLTVNPTSVSSGMKNVALMGRFQLISGDIPILLDVAHNPQAVRMLYAYLMEHFPDKKIHAVFSMMKDKDINTVIKVMKQCVENWFIAPLDVPRVASNRVLKTFFTENNIDNVILSDENFVETIKQVKQQAKKGDLILIFGSFFLVSKYLAEFGET